MMRHCTDMKITDQCNKNVDGAVHIIHSHKYNTNSTEDLSDMD